MNKAIIEVRKKTGLAGRRPTDAPVLALFFAALFFAGGGTASENAPAPTKAPAPAAGSSHSTPSAGPAGPARPVPVRATETGEGVGPADAVASAAEKGYPRPWLLMETDKLAARLKTGANCGTDGKPARLVLIDARGRRAHAAGHLPGAFFLEADLFQDPRRDDYLPGPKEVRRIAADFGIGPETRVVVYDAHGGLKAARLWFTLTAYGHRGVSILDGGLPRWRAEGRPLEKTPPPPPARAGTWRPLEHALGVCRFRDLARFRRLAASGKKAVLPPTVIVDARSWAEYRGEEVRGPLGGHLPGAVFMEWKTALRLSKTDGTAAGYAVWRPAGELRALFRAARLKPGRPVVVYDQAGARSAHLLFTLQLMGFSRVYNYVGGWRDYAKRKAAAEKNKGPRQAKEKAGRRLKKPFR